PVADRLSARVVISNRTRKDLESLYEKNNIPKEYASRINVIPNSIDIVEPRRDDTGGSFNIAYVGRAGEEKRVELIAEIAQELSSSDPGIQFHFVGNIKPFLPATLHKGNHFHGEITDQDKLDKL